MGGVKLNLRMISLNKCVNSRPNEMDKMILPINMNDSGI
jgi:hypothetical protein